MFDGELFWHIFRVMWMATLALLCVAAILFTIYALVGFMVGAMMETYETIMEKRMIRRRERSRERDG